MSHSPPFAAALLFATAVLPASAADVDKVMELAKPAIVRIEVLMAEGQDGRMVKQRGFGSGAIITPDGYVLTNHHVAGRGTRFRCTMADREEIPTTTCISYRCTRYRRSSSCSTISTARRACRSI